MRRGVTAGAPKIDRDRWDRPLVIPPGGGKAVPYTRCTRFVGVLEDTYKLQLWQQRMVAVGLADRPDLLLAASAHRDDKEQLNEIASKAKEAATAGAAATTGTAIHSLTERVDRAEALPALPAAYAADLDAYRAATAGLAMVAIEQFVVNDALRVGGTPDRVVERHARRYVADVKTGQIEYGMAKIAMQMAVYARSLAYDIPTGGRSDLGVDLSNGIVIHLPAGEGQCTLWWVDLAQGWQGVQIAAQVRDWRKLRMKHLTAPFAA